MDKKTVEIDKITLFKIYHEALHIKLMCHSGPACLHAAGAILAELEKAMPQLKEATPLR